MRLVTYRKGSSTPHAIPRPARHVFCLGRNYKEHAAERGAEAPPHPVYFTKAPECVLAPAARASTTPSHRSWTTRSSWRS